MFFINVIAVQCSFIEECEKNEKFPIVEYLDPAIEHEPKCFKNYLASP